MTNAKSELRVQVVDDEIIVTLPGSHYSVTYYKPAKSPQLIAKYISDRDDPRVAMRLSEFLARAWRLANDKTRELGWEPRDAIVSNILGKPICLTMAHCHALCRSHADSGCSSR